MNFRGLDLNLLLVFDAMLEECRTVAVAQRLGTSQPTVSASLTKLRRFFGDELFVRRGMTMEPTPLAQSLQSPVRQIVEIVRSDLLIEGEFDPATAKRCFTLSTSDIGELVFLPKLLEATAREAPGISFRCVANSSAELKAMMTIGQLDLAIGYFPDITGAGFYEQSLFEHSFACLVRCDHPTVGDSLTLEQFLALDHIVVEPTGRSQEILEQTLAQLALQRRIILRSPHFMCVPLLIAETNAIATVPLALARIFTDRAELKMLPMPIETPTIALKLLWHSCVHKDPGVMWLRQLIARLYMNRAPSAS